MYAFAVHCSVLSSDIKASVWCYLTSPFSTFVYCDVIDQMANNSWYVDSCPIDRCTLQSLTIYSAIPVTLSKICSWWCVLRMVACEDPLFSCLPCAKLIWQDFDSLKLPEWQEMWALPSWQQRALWPKVLPCDSMYSPENEYIRTYVCWCLMAMFENMYHPSQTPAAHSATELRTEYPVGYTETTVWTIVLPFAHLSYHPTMYVHIIIHTLYISTYVYIMYPIVTGAIV